MCLLSHPATVKKVVSNLQNPVSVIFSMGFLIVANAEERYLCFVDSMIPHRSITKVNQSETALTLFWRGPAAPYIGREAKSPPGLTLPFSV